MKNVIDTNELRRALGAFVTGVTIVTCHDADGEPVGLTVNSFNSVSLEPPLVLFSLALKANSLPAFRAAESFAVHVLASDQTALSNLFATRGEDKFAGLEALTGPEGAPFIAGCMARFGCKAAFEYEGGDHSIFVGEVTDMQLADKDPLIYHFGRYGRLHAEFHDRDDES